MKTYTAIAQTPTHLAQPSPSSIPGAEWGLWGAIAFLSVRELFKWFQGKENSETRLLHSLIEGLQSSQAQLLKQLVDTQANTNRAIDGLKTAVEALGQNIKVETAQIARSNHLAIREISARLDKLDGLGVGGEEDEPTAIRNGRK